MKVRSNAFLIKYTGHYMGRAYEVRRILKKTSSGYEAGADR